MAGSTALKSASGNLLSRFSSFAFSSSRLSEVCGPVLAGSSIRTLSTPRKQTKQWKQNYKLRLNRKRVFFSLLGKWFEPKSNIPWLKIMIIWVIGVMRRSIVGDWRFKWLTLDSEDGFRTAGLSKRQAPTTVLLRYPVNQMIIFNQGSLLLSI